MNQDKLSGNYINDDAWQQALDGDPSGRHKQHIDLDWLTAALERHTSRVTVGTLVGETIPTTTILDADEFTAVLVLTRWARLTGQAIPW